MPLTGLHRPLVALFAGMISIAGGQALPDRPGIQAPPTGQRIQARDGDLVIVEGDAQVRVVRRRQASARAIFDAQQHWVVLLVDYATKGGAPDGRVDATYTFHGISGEWPLGERWEGVADLEDYAAVGDMSPQGLGLGLRTADGFIQLFSMSDRGGFRVPEATAILSFRGSGRGGGGGESFAVAEQRQTESARRSVETPVGRGSASMRFSTSLNMTAGSVEPPAYPAPQAPVRVGGTLATPRKIVDVAPVLPDAARQAGVRGVVILEIIIGTDGTVTSARVLRSIPLLDAAAVEAARQWRYEPTQLNGRPVPVIMTVTVAF